MTGRFGIDTSVLMRLVSRKPLAEFERCVRELSDLIGSGGELVASSQVIGEAYVALQHHYEVPKSAARGALLDVLSSGLVTPLNGPPVLAALRDSGGAGLLDCLIVDGYSHDSLETLTLDRRMANLPGARLL